MHRRAVILLLAVFLSPPRLAAADLARGQEMFLRGDYRGARVALAKVTGKDRAAAQLTLLRVLERIGEYRAAEDLAEQLTRHRDADVAAGAAVFRAELMRLTGRGKEARAALEALLAKRGGPLRGRYILGLVYRDLGETKLATDLFEAFIADWNAGKIDRGRAEHGFYAAEAARHVAAYQDANDTFRDVVALDPAFLAANIEWGNLFLQKYAAGPAEQSFSEVLAIDPHHPDAQVGLAEVKLEQGYDLAAAHRHIESALSVNPNHIPALLVRAGVEIDQNRWRGATDTLDRVFAINPRSLEGRALLATIHWLRDDAAAYQKEKARVLGDNRDYAEFFHIVARSAVREHRYAEAIELEKEAVAIDPHYYEAMQAIGTGYLRLGDEKEGLLWLRRAWEGDEYNVRTYNTLELFEDVIPRQYSFVASQRFKIRYPREQMAVLRRYVEPLLERAYADMVERYQFRPTLPVIVELFAEAEHYSVRTVGLPNLGALGVCFGRVITAMSPSVGDLNWGMVLWHELAHVFAIQMSKSRVPRWFTEGLSEYETLIARPEWRRENDADLHAAMEAGSLPSVAELNYGFMQPDMEKVVVAYHLSSVAVEYIAQTYGFAKILAALRLFATGLDTTAVIEQITGLSVAEFDQRFHRYLAARLAPYRGTYRPPAEGLEDLGKLEAAVDAAPQSAAARARLALGHFLAGDAGPAAKAAAKALEQDPHQRDALYVRAELALRRGEMAAAKSYFHRLLSAGGDSADVRGRLGMVARRENDEAGAEKQFCAAKRLDPERSFPYQELAELYEERGRKERALAELEHYSMLEQMKLAPLRALMAGYAELGTWEKVRRFAEMALFINPADGDLLLRIGAAYLETGDPAQALFSYDSALLVTPPLRRPALAHLGRGRALLAQNRRPAARQAIDLALHFEPENAAALELREALGR